MRKLLILLLTTLMVVLILIVIPIAMNVLGITDVFADSPCSGREKFVQHRITHKCKCLPEQAVAPPWELVNGDTCPAIVEQISDTPFQPLITWTPIPKPTDTRWPTLTSTSPPEPFKTTQLIATSKPTIQTALPVATGGVCIENDCDPTWALIHVRQTEAAVQATDLIWRMTTSP